MDREVPQPQKTQTSKLPKFLTTITPFSKSLALIIFITFPIVGFYLGLNTNSKQLIDTLSSSVNSPTPVPTEDEEVKYWVLARTENNQEKIITEFDTQSKDGLVHWRNWLFWPLYDSDSGQIQIIGHDINTDTAEVYFSKNSSGSNKYDWGQDPYELRNADLYVINDTLVFSIDGTSEHSYIQGGGIYKILLPPRPNSAIQLKDVDRGSIYTVGTRYWIVDARSYGMCGEVSDFWLFDSKKFTAKNVFTSDNPCGEGENFIGFDKEGNLIVGYHPGEDTPVGPGSGYIKYVSLINPDRVPSREILITESQIPDGIGGAKYSKVYNQIWLSTPGEVSNYLFDLDYFIFKGIDASPLGFIPDETNYYQMENKDNQQVLPPNYSFTPMELVLGS